MTPTERRFDAIYEIGRLPCRKRKRFSPCQVHHLNLGGNAGQRQLGDRYTIGLCPWHHQGFVGWYTEEFLRRELGPSLAKQSKLFRIEFGTDAELLAEQDRLIEEREQRRVA